MVGVAVCGSVAVKEPQLLPDLGVMWDGMAITFAKMVLRDFFLDAKWSVYVFLVQS
jgi:hypothetical protein